MTGIADVIRKRIKARDYYKELRSEVRQQGLIETMLRRRKRGQLIKEDRISYAVIERVKRIGKKKDDVTAPVRTQQIPEGLIRAPEVTRTKVKVQ